MLHVSEDISAVLRDELAIAAQRLRRANGRSVRVQGLSRAIIIAAATAGMVSVEIAIARLADVSVGIAVWTAAFGCIGAVVIFAASMSRRRPLPWCEVAERLDLAACSGNAIATALNLAEDADPSIFSRRAIVDGLDAARRVAAIEPLAPTCPRFSRASLAYLAGGIVAVIVSLIIPMQTANHLQTSRSIGMLVVGSSENVSAVHRPVDVQSTRKEWTKSISPAAPTKSHASAKSSNTNAVSSNSALASASVESTTPSPAAMAKTGAPETSSSSPSERSGASDPFNEGGKMPESTPQMLTLATFGTSAGQAAHSQNTPQGAAGSDSDPSNSSPDSGDKSRSDESNGNASGKPEKSQQQGGSDKQEDGESKDKDGQGSGMGNTMASGDQPSDQGQSSGQNATKKSRGVAPLLLGSRQPDLLQGRRLPGPDERTQMQIPPQPNPEMPQPSVQTAGRQKSESPVDVYRVPADAQQAVQQYFQQLHQEPAAASTRN